jgi:hypothetical protein
MEWSIRMHRINEVIDKIEICDMGMGILFHKHGCPRKSFHGMQNPVFYIEKKECTLEEAQTFVAEHGKVLAIEHHRVAIGEQRHINLRRVF